MVLDNSLLLALIPTLPGPRPSRMVTKAADNGVDCTPDTNVSRTAPAPFTWPPSDRPVRTAPLRLPGRAAVSMETYVWCTSGSQGPYSSRGSTALHRH